MTTTRQRIDVGETSTTPDGHHARGGAMTATGAHDPQETLSLPETTRPALYDSNLVTLGRYRIDGVLGTGGMGRVFDAYDPRLDRPVALKLLRPFADALDRARFLREAQAMAQLSHPNLLPIYDVGYTADGPFIAMERVTGQTLRGWLRAKPRSWSAILAVCVAAGRGLAAAHGAGIVHRDFKPSNVMVGDDGRVRVMDFGLARNFVDEHSPTDPDLDGPPLTMPGTLMGTPAYMAPEQYRGALTDGRCDQYAFCLTLWEALYGTRPFEGRELTEQFVAKLRIEPTPPSSTDVPRWIYKILARGLSAMPQARFASMNALLEALRPHKARAWRRTLTMGTGLLVLTAGLLGWAAPHEPLMTIPDTDPDPVAAGVSSCEEPGATAQAQALREQLSRARMLAGTEHPEHALTLVANARRHAEHSGCGPLAAEALVVEGFVRGQLGDPAGAVDSLLRAYFEADRLELDRTRATASIELTQALERAESELADAQKLAHTARLAYLQADGDHRDALAQLDAWIAEHD